MKSIYSYFFDSEKDCEYIKGGFFPVKIGDRLNQRYVVHSKLGYGHYATVWLCTDDCSTVKKKYVAMKIVRSDENYYRGFIL
jgi:serine/threonine protein kinase